MLKCHFDDATNTAGITVKGNLITILADLTYLIRDIYLACQKSNPIMGDAFKNALRMFVDDDSSLIWEESDTDETKKHGGNNVSIRIPRAMQELLDDLREAAEHDE